MSRIPTQVLGLSRNSFQIFMLIVLVSALEWSCSLVVDPQLSDFAEYGERCRQDSDCISSICVKDRCTLTCDKQIPCVSDSFCSEGYCQFNSPLPFYSEADIHFFYIDEIGEYGWSKAQDSGRIYLTSKIDNIVSCNHTSISSLTATKIIEDAIEDGAKVIVNTREDLFPIIQNAAARYFSVNFLSYGNKERDYNLGNYDGRMYQVMYVIGALAGRITKTQTLGIVGPEATPTSVRWINSFTRGAQSQDASIRVMVRWVNSRFADTLEKNLADNLVAHEADIILPLTDSTILVEWLQETYTPTGFRVYTIGFNNANICELAPNDCLTSAFWNWGPLFSTIVGDMQQGQWIPLDYVWERMRSDREISVVYFSDINTNIVSLVDVAIVEEIIPDLTRNTNESLMWPFRGEIIDNKGEIRIANGEFPTDQNLLEMCWFVDGVINMDGSPAVVPETCTGIR